MQYGSNSLETISQDGVVPETRMKDASSVQDFAKRLIDNDSRRSWKRARVNGLVDGNPPYKASKLREAGRADACNVNWGIARSYLESSVGSFYDLFSEASGYITIKTDYGTPEQKDSWSNIISEEADNILRKDPTWDYNMQISQWDMVLHGCGPFLFEDAYCVLPKAFLCGDLKVPEFTKSDTGYWESCMIQATYYPPELYRFIENEEAANKVGWDVEYTKRVIASAMDIRQQAGIQYEWDFYQQELKNNSLAYYDDSKICRVAHVFWKEFNGRITHSIVERDTADGIETKFLYRRIGRYEDFQNCIHPMYFDHGNGGYHHSVTGLGVKMFAAMEYENRLICNLADKAFAPKILFKPTTAEASQKFSLAMFGDYAVLPSGFDSQQTGVAGLMNDGLAMHSAIQGLLQSNLSSYRQQVPADRPGNPPTAFQKQLEATQQSALNKTQFNRYYQQLDMLYSEIYLRLSNLNSADKRAIEFQEKCKKRGVPKEAMNRISKIQATRVTGQGSAFMRKMAIDSLFVIAGSLPEDGRQSLIEDKIACEAGQASVTRYYPKKQPMSTDQEAEATQWVGLMKIGVPPKITSSQNPVTFAMVFLSAASQAVASLQQGANPMEVLKFIEIAGPAVAAHLKRFASDPTRQQMFKVLSDQWKQLAGVADMLKKKMQQAQQDSQAQSSRTQQTLNDIQLKNLKTKSDIELKAAKTKAQLRQSAEKHAQKMALDDATTAHEITTNRLKALNTKD